MQGPVATLYVFGNGYWWQMAERRNCLASEWQYGRLFAENAGFTDGHCTADIVHQRNGPLFGANRRSFNGTELVGGRGFFWRKWRIGLHIPDQSSVAVYTQLSRLKWQPWRA